MTMRSNNFDKAGSLSVWISKAAEIPMCYVFVDHLAGTTHESWCTQARKVARTALRTAAAKRPLEAKRGHVQHYRTVPSHPSLQTLRQVAMGTCYIWATHGHNNHTPWSGEQCLQLKL